MQFGSSLLLAVLGIVSLAGGSTLAKDRKDDSKPTFRVGVETVFVNVSVTDPLNRSVTGLDQNAFKVFENKVEQKVTFFSEDPAPISVGIIFDRSGSMKSNGNINAARAAIARFMEGADSRDEFALITFNQEATLVTDFTHESGAVANQIALDQPSGRTALYDAVYMGLQQMKKARNDRKAIILVTDGEDNSSRYSPNEVKDYAKETDVQIYGIGEQGQLGYGRYDIEEIVQMTGGRAFFPSSFNDLDYYIDLIHSELRNQYILGYVPSDRTHDGKWRKLQIKLDAPEGLPKLVVRTREGYFTSKQ
jgi:Ca-activated chloride channel homolog